MKFLILPQKRIAIIFRRIEGFFDGAGRYPAQQIDHGAGLIVGARSPGAAKWLLTNYGTGWLIINIKITGCIP